MKPQYFSVYNNFDLIQPNLQDKLQSLFTQPILTTPLSYQQLLAYLDEQCQRFSPKTNLQSNPVNDHSRMQPSQSQNNHHSQQLRKFYFRADRNISKQIFDNCSLMNSSKVTLETFIQKYIELLETAKLCVIREQAKQQVLTHRLQQARKVLRDKTYVYIRMIQASVHSRYSDSPCFQYKLTPSSIPIITVLNSLNPILNHEYTLEMDQDQFWIVFYQSGIQIYKWKFSISQHLKDGEYFKSTATQAVTFQVQVKMLPKKTSEQTIQLQKQLSSVQDKLILTKKAFQNFCYYMPFQQSPPKMQESPSFDPSKGFFWNFTTSLFSLLPFLKHHLLVLNYVLIALIFVECLASVSWAVEFVDLIIAFGLLGVIHDKEKQKVRTYLMIGLFAIFFSIFKSIWAALLIPFGMPKYPLILAIAIIFKVFTLFFIWICTIRSSQVPDQRKQDIYGIKDEQEKSQTYQEPKPIFKANENYFKNKRITNEGH